MTIDDTLKKHEEHLMSIPGVVGLGVGERGGQPVVLLMVDRPVGDLQGSHLPSTLEGFPVQVDLVGEVSAF